MKIAIFGSCVSRDTCEFIPNAEVVTYVARHSVTSLNSPHGTFGIDLSNLSSAFQKRMVTSDLQGSGIKRIIKNVSDVDLVLIDLVDERRGYWLFPDGTTMTNSLEVEACGAGPTAQQEGARIVAFGTDEHFNAWQSGFETLIDELKTADLWDKSLLLNIDWARAFEGAQHPQAEQFAKLGRRWRRLRRGARGASRALSAGRGMRDAWTSFQNVEPTVAEEFADRAVAANWNYNRYRREARSLTISSVERVSSEVRIGRNHKWGPQPFHYRDEDYRSIVDSIIEFKSHSTN